MIELILLLIQLVLLGTVAFIGMRHEDELIRWEDRQVAKLKKKVKRHD